jgi:formate dehydrogenase iron-sulfur subunit
VKVYVPKDAAAIAVGADAVADKLAEAFSYEQIEPTIVRTGSRGMFDLEPLVEVEQSGSRIGFARVDPDDAYGLVAAILYGMDHHGAIGDVEELLFLKRQQRLTFARCGKIDPASLADYSGHGGLKGLDRAFAIGRGTTIDEIICSGLRGRGGAGFPTGAKWKTVAETSSDQKYIVCNADEGDSGTFADRMLMEGDPFLIVEGMAIAGFAVGASYGYIYIRSEYPHAIKTMNGALETARRAGILGHDFDMEVRVGAGAYVCGEETSLLESIEGKRGEVRAKPPLPAHVGLFGRPTVINNVLSLAAVPFILAEGGKAYAAFGMGRSRGTMPIQLAGNIKHGGLFETAFGITLDELINDIGGGTASGRPVRAVQVGGPLGAYIPVSQFHLPFDYEAFAEAGALIGHAGVVVFDDTVDMAKLARFAMQFCAAESCGKCTPCRIGSIRGVEIMDHIIAGKDVDGNTALIEDLCETMKYGSLCALGGFTPYPVMSALTYFGEDFRRNAPGAAEKVQ